MSCLEAIILRKSPRREADLVFEVYSRQLGLTHFQAKGVRRGSAKLKDGLDIFNYVDVDLASAKYLPIVTDVRVLDSFGLIKENLGRLRLAQAAAYVLGKSVEPNWPEADLWRQTLAYFRQINNQAAAAAQLRHSVYEWCYQFLKLNGLATPPPRDEVLMTKLFRNDYGIDLATLL
ncbi:MAG: DNA repair protein RecO [Parcubacteria group bacterium]|nr:DNA repair protein RecO [Parcubacteria group bacterium]